jgi:hypothetical protein
MQCRSADLGGGPWHARPDWLPVLRERTAAMNMVAMSDASRVQSRRKAAGRWNVDLLVEG